MCFHKNKELLRSIWESSGRDASPERLIETKIALLSFKKKLSTAFSSDTGAGVRHSPVWKYVALAAIFFLLLSGGYILFLVNAHRSSDKEPILAEIIEVSTARGQQKNVILPDGTSVTLNSESRITYPSLFNTSKRQVYFRGEAIFDVSSDEQHPFRITTGDVSVEVVGTSFNLRSYPTEKDISVSLYRGKVNFVYTNSQGFRDTYKMTAGEYLSYNTNSKSVLSLNSDNLNKSNWTTGSYYFKNMTLSDICSQLERIYNVEIYIRDAKLAKTPFFLAIVEGQSIDDVIDLLNMNSVIHARRTNNTIEIY